MLGAAVDKFRSAAAIGRVRSAVERLMELGQDAGRAGNSEKSPSALLQRSGDRDRDWETDPHGRVAFRRGRSALSLDWRHLPDIRQPSPIVW